MSWTNTDWLVINTDYAYNASNVPYDSPLLYNASVDNLGSAWTAVSDAASSWSTV